MLSGGPGERLHPSHCLCVCCSAVVSWMQTPLALGAMCLGGAAIPWVGVLKIWVLGTGSKPFIPQGEAAILGFPPDCMALHRAGVYSWGLGRLSFLLASVWVFSCSPTYESRSASFWLFSENVAPHVAIHSACPREEGAGAFCVARCKDSLRILSVNCFFPGMGRSEHGCGMKAEVPPKKTSDKRGTLGGAVRTQDNSEGV